MKPPARTQTSRRTSEVAITCPRTHDLEPTAQFAVAAGDGLHRLVAGSGRKAHRPELAGRVGAHVPGRVEDTYPEDGRLDPAVERRGRAVLRGHDGPDRAVELACDQLQRPHVVERADLQVRRRRCADGSDGDYEVVVFDLVGRAEHRTADPRGQVAHQQAVVDPSSSTAGEHRPAPNGIEGIIVGQLSCHSLSSRSCRSPRPALSAADNAAA